MGGYVAFAMQRLAPDRVIGLVLSNTRAGADSPDARAGRDRMIDLVRRDGQDGVAREMVPRLLGETTRRHQPDLADAVRRLILVNSVEAITTALGALKTRPDSTPGLGAIACPALVITGDEDAIIPVGDAEAMHRGIPNASLVVLPRIGHLSNLEDPGAWSRAVEAGLNAM
jgi:3-oxoadipate enol-lactonase